jgi:hypothetical protein
MNKNNSVEAKKKREKQNTRNLGTLAFFGIISFVGFLYFSNQPLWEVKPTETRDLFLNLSFVFFTVAILEGYWILVGGSESQHANREILEQSNDLLEQVRAGNQLLVDSGKTGLIRIFSSYKEFSEEYKWRDVIQNLDKNGEVEILSYTFREFSSDPDFLTMLFKEIETKKIEVKILFMSENNPAVSNPFFEDSKAIPASELRTIQEEIRDSIKSIDSKRVLYDISDTNFSYQIIEKGLIERGIVRIGEEIFIFPYINQRNNAVSPVLVIKDKESALYKIYQKEFKNFLKLAKEKDAEINKTYALMKLFSNLTDTEHAEKISPTIDAYILAKKWETAHGSDVYTQYLFNKFINELKILGSWGSSDMINKPGSGKQNYFGDEAYEILDVLITLVSEKHSKINSKNQESKSVKLLIASTSDFNFWKDSLIPEKEHGNDPYIYRQILKKFPGDKKRILIISKKDMESDNTVGEWGKIIKEMILDGFHIVVFNKDEIADRYRLDVCIVGNIAMYEFYDFNKITENNSVATRDRGIKLDFNETILLRELQKFEELEKQYKPFFDSTNEQKNDWIKTN